MVAIFHHIEPKSPCELRMEKSIFSLKASKSVGKLQGIESVSAQVDTLGKEPSSQKMIYGVPSPNPNGGMQSQPVKKTITSFSVGELTSP